MHKFFLSEKNRNCDLSKGLSLRFILGLLWVITAPILHVPAFSCDSSIPNDPNIPHDNYDGEYSERSNKQGRLTGNEFVAVAAFNAGPNPTAGISGDFNKDGKLDIAIANKEGVLVFLKNEGIFAHPVSYNIEGHPVALAVGDFNGDEKEDLVTANFKNDTVTILLGKGNGVFDRGVTISAGVSPSSIVTGFFNNDSYYDMAVSNFNSNTISVFLGSERGTFKRESDIKTGLTPRGYQWGILTMTVSWT